MNTEGLQLDLLATLVQNHVQSQPWSRYGSHPVPLEFSYNAESLMPWSVRYVKSVRGSRRNYGRASGKDLLSALRRAREDQLSGP